MSSFSDLQRPVCSLMSSCYSTFQDKNDTKFDAFRETFLLKKPIFAFQNITKFNIRVFLTQLFAVLEVYLKCSRQRNVG